MSSALDRDLQDLKHLNAESTSRIQAELPRFFSTKHGLVLQKALALMQSHNLRTPFPPVEACFDRLASQCKKRDPGCSGKEALLRFLVVDPLGHSDLLLKAVRFVQWEPIWGGLVDTAPSLRGLAVLGLVRAQHPEAPQHIASLLADPEIEARRGAFEALLEAPSLWAHPLLTLFSRFENDVQLRSDALTFLLEERALSAQDVLPELTSSSDDWREAAALALSNVPSLESTVAVLSLVQEEPQPARRQALWPVLLMTSRSEGRSLLMKAISDLGTSRQDELLQVALTLDDQDLVDHIQNSF
jgi:hypothetical protein